MQEQVIVTHSLNAYYHLGKTLVIKNKTQSHLVLIRSGMAHIVFHLDKVKSRSYTPTEI